MEQRKDIITIGVTEFPKGIGLSSREGMQLVQDIDPFNIDGTLQAGFKTVNTFPDPFDATFSADPATDQITMNTTLEYVREGITFTGTGRAIVMISTGSMPAGLVQGTTYFAIQVSSLVIKVASTYANAIAGTAINITSTGSGVLEMFDVRQEVIMHYAVDQRGGVGDSIYGQDIKGLIWNYQSATGWHLVVGNSPSLTDGFAYGMTIWRNYLFAFNSATVDVMKLSTGIWTNAWSGATNLSFGNYQSNKSHTAFVPYGNINVMYFANAGNGSATGDTAIPYAGSLQQTPGTIFDPGTPSTYNWNPTALQLPDNQYITDFEELGGYLAIASIGNCIYLWDTTSTDGFQNIIPTLEEYVSCLKTINGILYYGAGFRGNIYSTLGTTSQKVLDFSDQVSNVPQTLTFVNDIENYNGYMLFSITGAMPGLYLMDPDNEYRYHLKNVTSTSGGIPGAIFTYFNPQLYGGNYGDTASYAYYRYFFSWSDTFTLSSTIRGCDSNFILTNGQWRQTDGNSYFISQLYRVADNQDPYTFDQCNLYLTEPIIDGQKVIIQTRLNNADAFSFDNQMVFDFSEMTNGGGVAGNLSISVENARMFQAKVIIYIPPNTGQTSQYTTPKISEITFK